MALRTKKAHVTHPELKATFCLPIIGVKKNPNSALYTQLGVITKGWHIFPTTTGTVHVLHLVLRA